MGPVTNVPKHSFPFVLRGFLAENKLFAPDGWELQSVPLAPYDFRPAEVDEKITNADWRGGRRF
jgi:hypothetical protein